MKEQADLPLASCLMATHGRFEEVCRTVWDFLVQDYPNRELVILNNHPQPLKLPYNCFQVRIINEPGHATLGDCRRRLLEEARGEYVRTWDDDDVYLPWTISQGVAHIGDQIAFKPQYSWFNPEGGGFRLEDNVFEASMLTRTDFAREHPYQATAGDEHLPLVDALHNMPGALVRRDLGAWASYVYRWGWGVHHISGTMGSDTTENRTLGWMAANQDSGEDWDGELQFHAAEKHRTRLYTDMAPYCREYRHEFYSRCAGESPPGSPAAGSFGTTHNHAVRKLLPLYQGPICAMEFGRDHLGSTRDLLGLGSVRRLISVDPRLDTFQQVKDGLSMDDLGRITMLGELSSCCGCDLPERPHYLTLNAGSAMQNLQAFLSVRTVLAPGAIVSCRAVDAFLLRTVLDPTHKSQQVEDYILFEGREIPAWLHWQNLNLQTRTVRSE